MDFTAGRKLAKAWSEEVAKRATWIRWAVLHPCLLGINAGTTALWIGLSAMTRHHSSSRFLSNAEALLPSVSQKLST